MWVQEKDDPRIARTAADWGLLKSIREIGGIRG
jgi:hypothetical protein